ncbi:hypothetical protein [Paraburkholderia rhizosphaerae]|uniref:Uncharacterized protein n=1 Tax=Paraburkholderia rhizosphaerae TaxID=480658 RepID=A0A4R8LJ95_9BURK|nr:hypothetical protein [Paraburkholderia rhizosphaerae]TDY43861.1 hypothetical protein BX592_11763 [Paraburkholderia rhizosphaerae]
MEFDYRHYHIDASPLAEGGRYFARARIFTAAGNGARDEVKWSGDVGQFSSQEDAAECGRNWAIDWCDSQS